MESWRHMVSLRKQKINLRMKLVAELEHESANFKRKFNNIDQVMDIEKRGEFYLLLKKMRNLSEKEILKYPDDICDYM